jgi:hydrogenase expression/formation protein HypD
MAGIASPQHCRLFGKECRPENPVGACMVSSEGTCRIWHQYGGVPRLERAGTVTGVVTEPGPRDAPATGVVA